MLNSADLIHTTSAIEKDNVSSFGIKTKSFIVPNGVDVINRNEYKLKLIKTNKKICLFLGRLDPVKGLDLLIESWNKVKNDSWLLVICGPDEKKYKKDLLIKIKRYDLEKHVMILNPIYSKQKFNLYTQSDIFVLPSYGENFGISVAEALACGIPVITTSFTPWSDIVKYRCGWYINLDLDSLVYALNDSFSTTKSHLIDMGNRGVELVREKYSWENISNSMYLNYINLLYEK
jgi:glycosyltransferase involved in cell wall biosynthesis